MVTALSVSSTSLQNLRDGTCSNVTICDAGKYSSAAATTCTNCDAGKYSTTVGATEASTCKEHLANASCGICPQHSWTLDDGSANVSACVCDPGFSKPEPEDHALPCKPCEPGYYKPTQADEACLPCPEHHYCPSDSSQGSIEPRACPTNSSAASPLPQVLVYETSASSRRAMRWRAVVEDCLCDAGFYFAVASVNNSIFECEYN